METTQKIAYFKAFLFELLKWNEEINNINNDFSKLKVLKLFFLWVSKNNQNIENFKFLSWNLWPVEKDIYDAIKNDALKDDFIVSNSCTTKINKDFIPKWDAKEFGEYTVQTLKEQNPELINLPAYTLVDITHKWDCWKLTQAFWIDVISSHLILSEEWYFA